MAKKGKDARVQVILECTEHKDSGMPGTSRYITTKNRKNTTADLARTINENHDQDVNNDHGLHIVLSARKTPAAGLFI